MLLLAAGVCTLRVRGGQSAREEAMFPAAPPGTDGAELSASRPGALKNSGPMDASSHEYLNGYGI